MRSEQERLAAEAQREADTERDEMQRITLSATPTPSPYNPPPPVPPVTFSAMGSDGRFTVLLREDVVRDMAKYNDDAWITPSRRAFAQACKEALAAHDRDTAREAWLEAARDAMVRSGASHVNYSDLHDLYDLAKGTDR